MSDKTNTKDALGNPIQFGKTYGYTKDNNGITDVVICIPRKFTASGQVSVDILKRSRALWKHEAEDKPLGVDEYGFKTASKTSTKPIKLFPVEV